MDSKSYIASLKKLTRCRLLVYEDNHPLSTGSAEIDHIINVCLWFFEHIPIHTEFKDKK